jgi:benzoylformate decarboxylase
MSVAFVLQTLADIRNPADIVVEEAPSARPVMQEYLPITRTGTFLTMESGGLGYGMPAAVGVALAKPGTRVIALIGDGSSMYSIQAIWSAVQLNLPIAFVILNNSRYAALQDFAPVFGFAPTDPVQGTDLPGLDFVTLAAGMGCRGVAVREASLLKDVLNEALHTTGPMLVETIVA